MPTTHRSDSPFARRLAMQYGVDAVPSLVTTSRSGSELGIAHMQHALPHLFVLDPLPAEDAFLLSVEIASGGSRRVARGGDLLQLGLQHEGAIAIDDLSDSAAAYVCSPFHSVLFHLPRETLDAFADEMALPRADQLRCDAGTVDPVLANLGRAVLPALLHPQETSTLFVDHLMLALKAHLLHTYGGVQPDAAPPPHGLAAWQERRAKSFLMAHLAGDTSLAEVARECGLSRSHFSRAFKKSTGQAPHAWLVDQRVDAAKRLLQAHELPIAEVASACGFSDQSHLTRVFTARTGITPARWRRGQGG